MSLPPSAPVLPASPSRRAPAPVPPLVHPGFWGFFKALRDNPITAFAEEAYREPYLHLPGGRIRPSLTVVTDPALLRRVFVDAVEIYGKGDVVRRRLTPFLGDSLLIAELDSWRPQRRIAAPLFNARRVEACLPAMLAAAGETLAALEARGDGAVIDLGDEMSGFTYDVIARIAFSSDSVTDPRAFSHAIGAYFDSLGRLDLASYLRLPAWVPTVGRLRARPALALFRREIGGIVSRRRARLERDGAEALPDDLLTRLLTARDAETGAPLSPDLVYDNAVTFLSAGHETTANVLTWTLFLLSQHPDWEARCVAEAEAALATGDGLTAGAFAGLTQTRMVVDEAMRLYPPAPIIPRVALAPDWLGDLAVKPGDFVFTAPWISHRHRRRWQDPDDFRPERFAPGLREGIDRLAYFPFGAGPRVCIGASFAVQEVLAALATWLPRLRFQAVAPESVFPQATITLRPGKPVGMRVTRR